MVGWEVILLSVIGVLLCMGIRVLILVGNQLIKVREEIKEFRNLYQEHERARARAKKEEEIAQAVRDF